MAIVTDCYDAREGPAMTSIHSTIIVQTWHEYRKKDLDVGTFFGIFGVIPLFLAP